MFLYNRELLSGINRCRIEAYLKEIANEYDDDEYFGDQWHIILEETQDNVYGKIILPRTRMIVTGEEEACTDVIHRFRMKFLSAGG